MVEPLTNADLCSARSVSAGEPLAGSAPQAQVWVLIEQPGPWGRDAIVDSHLDPELGQQLRAWAEPYPIRLGTIRRLGRHADQHVVGDEHAILIARCTPDGAWLWQTTNCSPELVCQLDQRTLLEANSPPATLPAGHQVDRVLLVCTNSKRDRCCALLGRGLAA
ncbi:MAG TPA: sucrase ferredoxin, partial [Actinomycetes bacterium]|nr:sucrase ferredoxin [Actinomycetes bacterium]